MSRKNITSAVDVICCNMETSMRLALASAEAVSLIFEDKSKHWPLFYTLKYKYDFFPNPVRVV